MQWEKWRVFGDPIPSMEGSSLGNGILERWLSGVRVAVERDGELSEATVQRLVKQFGGKPNSLTVSLEKLRVRRQSNQDGLKPEMLRQRNQQEALKWLDGEIGTYRMLKSECMIAEGMDEKARMAAAALPSAEVLEKIQRYETKLHRQIHRALAQLERVQRLRRGEAIPAPLTVELSERD